MFKLISERSVILNHTEGVRVEQEWLDRYMYSLKMLKAKSK